MVRATWRHQVGMSGGVSRVCEDVFGVCQALVNVSVCAVLCLWMVTQWTEE